MRTDNIEAPSPGMMIPTPGESEKTLHCSTNARKVTFAISSHLNCAKSSCCVGRSRSLFDTTASCTRPSVLTPRGGRTDPDRAHVLAHSVRWDPLVVLLEEHVVLVLAIDESASERLDIALKLLGLEELVREGHEREVEEGCDLRVLEAGRLGEAVPETVEVREERRAEVREGSRANVVADHEEEQRLVLLPATPRQLRTERSGGGKTYAPEIFPFCFAERNRARFTSNTVLRRPMFAPWYSPTWCSQILTMSTSATAMENSADLRSKSYASCQPGSTSLGTREPYLVLTALSPVGPLDVHDEDWHFLALRHPDAFGCRGSACGSTAEEECTLGRLTTFVLVHDIELCAKEPVEEGA